MENQSNQHKQNIWAFNPFHGGSHRDFLDSWIEKSVHKWKLHTLSPHHWKWRMRQAPLYFSTELERDQKPDAVFCTSMFNLCEFKGLVPSLSEVPSLMYFHENQLTYPIENESERDLHLAFSQFSAALAADLVLFNSHYHREQYLGALCSWLKRMPGPSLLSCYDKLIEKSMVEYPGINIPTDVHKEHAGPLKLLWAARWEEDKNPKLFLNLLKKLEQDNLEFQVSFLGCKREQVLSDLESQKIDLQRCKTIGFVDEQMYQNILKDSDVFISTAHHEFFGLSALQAAASGCALLLPNRCAYPELYSRGFESVVFHDDQIEFMMNGLRGFQQRKLKGDLVDQTLLKWTHQFEHKTRCDALDQKFSQLCDSRQS